MVEDNTTPALVMLTYDETISFVRLSNPISGPFNRALVSLGEDLPKTPLYCTLTTLCGVKTQDGPGYWAATGRTPVYILRFH